MIFSPDASERIAICEACKHFRKKTRTCGTPVVGNKVGNKRLCGCFMDIKSTLKFAHCPLGKWKEQQISEEEYLEVKELLETTEKTGRITTEQSWIMRKYLRKYLGVNYQHNSCAPCVKNNLHKLHQIINEYEK